jgi:hypothetical protein
MARAFRNDLLESERWRPLLEGLKRRLDAAHPEKCPTCDVAYTIYFRIIEDIDTCVGLLRDNLRRECPDHVYECYVVDEDHSGRIVGEI